MHHEEEPPWSARDLRHLDLRNAWWRGQIAPPAWAPWLPEKPALTHRFTWSRDHPQAQQGGEHEGKDECASKTSAPGIRGVADPRESAHLSSGRSRGHRYGHLHDPGPTGGDIVDGQKHQRTRRRRRAVHSGRRDPWLSVDR